MASLQRPLENQILNAHDLFLFARGLEKIHVEFCTHEEYFEEEVILKQRFESSITLPGTQKYHAFIPFSKTEIIAKIFSNAVDNPKPSKIMNL